jgi:hypothetical protein
MSSSSALGSRNGASDSATEPGGEPLFERLGNNVEETQHFRQVIDALQHRVNELERINLDLEYRLEDSAKQCMEVEKECVAVENAWKVKAGELQKEIETWRRNFDSQMLKTDKLREHLSRTEKELYSILQRKYELMRGPGRGLPGNNAGGTNNSAGPGQTGKRGGLDGQISHGNVGGNSASSTDGESRRGKYSSDRFQTNNNKFFPEDPYTMQEAHAPQEIRQRRMLASLSDFLNL